MVWHDMEVLVITSLNLENLTISQNYVKPRSCLFVISAPNLSFFEYSGKFPLLLSQLDGFPCLERVNIDIDIDKYQWKKVLCREKTRIFPATSQYVSSNPWSQVSHTFLQYNSGILLIYFLKVVDIDLRLMYFILFNIVRYYIRDSYNQICSVTHQIQIMSYVVLP